MSKKILKTFSFGLLAKKKAKAADDPNAPTTTPIMATPDQRPRRKGVLPAGGLGASSGSTILSDRLGG